MTYRSPVTGALLVREGHALVAAGERWPVIDGVPYLRVGRERLARRTLDALDAGEHDVACATLLADQDDWWRGSAADPVRLLTLVEGAGRLSLREALGHLGFGPVGDYFLHRWSDPTFLAGLALLEAHWTAPATAFELACGIGHYARELARRGVAVTGGDVVFAKLWLARRFVVPDSVELVCFDAAAPWPIAGRRYDLALCCDAFYFLEPKAAIAELLRDAAPALAIGHIHNAGNPGFSPGSPLDAGALAALFPDGVAYDDAELTAALVEARAPAPRDPADLTGVEAFSVAAGPAIPRAPRPVADGLALPPDGEALRRNPLYADGEVAWPSQLYAAEYAARATYLPVADAPERATAGIAVEALARRRALVDLPERW